MGRFRIVSVASLGALIAAIAALVRPSDRGDASNASSKATFSSKPASGADIASKSTDDKEQPTEPGRRWLAEFFGVSPQSLTSMGYEIGFLVATIADPVESHLDWMFDAQLDALRRAYESAGYVPVNYWLPWGAEISSDLNAAMTLRHETPGVLLFRDQDPDVRHLELCYLVGEVPTNGIHIGAFTHALKDREDLRDVFGCGASDELRVVGPTFSGSSLSLRRSLDQWLWFCEHRSVDIVTGAATSARNEQTLTGLCAAGTSSAGSFAAAGPNPDWRIHFRSTIHPDDVLFDALRDEIVPCLGIEPSHVAVVHEASTEYGSRTSSSRTIGDYLSVPFPMNVSTLRAAYGRDRKSPPNDLAPFGKQDAPRVELTLEESARPRETPPPLSPLTPPTTDLMMAELARTLQSRNIQLVVLIATDVRDKLFLGAEIKKRLADVQLVTTESNLLYLRPDFNDALRGMLVISTYPLLVRANDWHPQFDGTRDLAFASDGAEGTFNAAFSILRPEATLADYRSPTDTNEKSSRPPVWITTVGKSAMLPLNLYSPSRKFPSYPAPSAEIDRPSRRNDERHGFLPVAVVLLLGLVIVTLAAQQLDRWVGGRGVSRAILRGISTAPLLTVADVKYRVERVSLVVHRQLCMALVFVALLGLFLPTAVLIAGPSASHERGANPVGNSFLSLRLFCWVVALVAAVAALFKASNGVWLVFTHAGDFARLARDARTMPLKFRCLAIIEGLARLTVGAVAILYVWTTIGVATDILHLSALPQYELMFERVALIDQGVSPLVPLLLIGGGILTWSVWNLVRTQSLAETTSYEGSRDVATPHTPLPNGPESIRGRLECAIPTTWAVAFLLFLIALGAWLYSRFQPTVEGIVPFVGDEKRLPLPWFDILLRLGILGMLFAITWSFFRFVAVWDSLRTILQSHENPWFLAACDRAKEHLTAATLVNLWFPQAAGQIENTSRELWESVREHAWRVTTLAPTPTTAFKIAAQNFPKRSPANAVGESERGTTVMVVWSHLVATRRGEHAALTQMPAPMPSHLAALNETAEEFVALQFIEFVEWVTRQLRGLAIYLLVSIALLTLLLCSYPLYPQTVFRLVFLLIIASGISAVMFIVTQMNKNVVLSRITGTAPGVTTWDRTFVSNVVFLGLVPLLLFLCSVFPDVRQFFFAWIDPLLKVFVKA